MKRGKALNRRHVVKVLGTLVGGTAASGLALWALYPEGLYPDADVSGDSSSGDGSEALVDQNGKRFSFEPLRGRSIIMNFIFTQCASICPTQTRSLTRVQRALAPSVQQRVHFISVSIDPLNDTPEVLEKFASAVDADLSNWSFLTGPAREITRLAERYSARAPGEGTGAGTAATRLLNHRVAVYLLDAQHRLVQTYTGLPLDEPRLAREITDVDRMFNKS